MALSLILVITAASDRHRSKAVKTSEQKPTFKLPVNAADMTTAEVFRSVGTLSSEEARAVVRKHQAAYCRAHPKDPPGTKRTWLAGIPAMKRRNDIGGLAINGAKGGQDGGGAAPDADRVAAVVYASGDLVSEHLKVNRLWEYKDIRQMAGAMRAPVPSSAADIFRPATWRRRRQPLVVDVGANVGTFTLNAAARGAAVAAFEPMSHNLRLLRASLCANPSLMERVALYGIGLGTKVSTCFMLSDVKNRGNGFTECNRTPEVAKKYYMDTYNLTFEVRGAMDVMRLDDVIDADVQVMKLDVEGYEAEALKGAERLLENRNVWFILTECNFGILKATGVMSFLKFLDRRGYYVSRQSFKGPFIDPEDIKSGKPGTAAIDGNLYCTHKKLWDAATAAGMTKQAGAAGGRPGFGGNTGMGRGPVTLWQRLAERATPGNLGPGPLSRSRSGAAAAADQTASASRTGSMTGAGRRRSRRRAGSGPAGE